VWVNISDNGGGSVVVDPRTLLVDTNYSGTIGPLGTIGADSVGAFGSVWSYDVPSGAVDRWAPPHQVADVQVTHSPRYDGSCMTSMAAGGGAIWVTLAWPGIFLCDLS
jgi:hypothetical protein